MASLQKTKHAHSRTPLHTVSSLKAQADAQRTYGERLADWMTHSLGSATFLWVNALWFAIWILWNTVPGFPLFDPYPFGLLTTIVSLEAIILAIFVLISQNRAERVSDIREEVDLQIDVITEQEITKILEIVVRLAKKQGVDLKKDIIVREMLLPLNTGKIKRALERQEGK